MSIDVNWRTATSGPDGEALAERIRSFVHDKFQQVALPRFIRSVQVHSFDFGTIPPDLEVKDFCEPFADFYEEDDDGEVSDISDELVSGQDNNRFGYSDLNKKMAMSHPLRDPYDGDDHEPILRSQSPPGEHLNRHTSGIPGGTSTLGYHLISLGGLSGAQTPLAAVAGGTSFANGWPETESRFLFERPSPDAFQRQQQRQEPDIDTTNSASRPSTADSRPFHQSIGRSGSGSSKGNGLPGEGEGEGHPDASAMRRPPPRMRERKPEDFQVLCHAKYAGDVRLSLTAEILLDYPMPSFVGLPLKLNVTGISFDGVAVIAYIRKRVHFSFLSPEDADALIGSEQRERDNECNDGRPRSGDSSTTQNQKRHGGLLQEIRVESEIGRKENGKQVLKNVGKVERFVLAQVRRIFEEELVFPSFWTFLI